MPCSASFREYSVYPAHFEVINSLHFASFGDFPLMPSNEFPRIAHTELVLYIAGICRAFIFRIIFNVPRRIALFFLSIGNHRNFTAKRASRKKKKGKCFYSTLCICILINEAGLQNPRKFHLRRNSLEKYT